MNWLTDYNNPVRRLGRFCLKTGTISYRRLLFLLTHYDSPLHRRWRLTRLRGNFLLRRLRGREPIASFRCNICGLRCKAPTPAIVGRESGSCYHCDSTLRFRSLVRALSCELFGRSLVLSEFPRSKQLRGIGLSDSEIYAPGLADRFAYTNMWYHKEPRLDIKDLPPELEGTADFVIASDVFEHVAPPVQPAFDNLFRLLKPGGVCVFSVPYVTAGETQEYFPELFDYRLLQIDGSWHLVNVTRDGKRQEYDSLRFHGGAGTTLEMRVFAESSLRDHIARAGFERITFHGEDDPEHGIMWPNSESRPITMRRPG